MNRIKGSFLFKTLVHIMLFSSGLTLIISTYHVITYLNTYSTTTKSVYETPLFQSKYLKYVERVAVYIDYREQGYTSLATFDSSSTDISSLFKENENTNKLVTTKEDKQSEFDYYNATLNIDNASFQYYVKNINTGKIYASPNLENLVTEHMNSDDPDKELDNYLKSVQTNDAHLIINTKTKRYFTNVNRNYQYLSEENIDWVMNYISGNILGSEDSQSEYIICASINDDIGDTKDEFGVMYNHFNRLHANYKFSLFFVPISFLGILIFLVLAIAFSGYKRDKYDIVLNSFDKLYTEIGILLCAAGALLLYIFTTSICSILKNDFFLSDSYNLAFAYTLLYPFGMYGLLSIIRRCKANTLFHNSLLCILSKNLLRFIKSFFSERSLTYPLTGLFIIFILIEMLSFYLLRNPWFTRYDYLLVGILGYVILGRILFKSAIDISKIRNTTKSISEGNMASKIDTKSLAFAGTALGEYVNNIGDGISAAVDEKLKSERLKTELIANVSHDIKTPLTSIINYVDLLKKENLENERAEKYLDVLSAKSWRLKTLIEDLVEASKASSGTINLNLESLNLVELVRQSLGEFEDKFIAHNLEAVLTIRDEPVFILADGRSTYRIIENIFSNVNKYALSGTRIYIDINTTDDSVIVSVKNISATKLNINADELMERFVRGDLSRNTEGSGLGLSIAKSLASLQNATFDVILDGDLFKAVVTFKKLLNLD